MRTLILAAALLTAAVPAFAQDAAKFSTSTTKISQLFANPEAKAVVLKHMPEIAQFADQIGDETLKSVQPKAPPGAITDEVLAKVDADLAKIK